jgi:hypothetical protein
MECDAPIAKNILLGIQILCVILGIIVCIVGVGVYFTTDSDTDKAKQYTVIGITIASALSIIYVGFQAASKIESIYNQKSDRRKLNEVHFMLSRIAHHQKYDVDATTKFTTNYKNILCETQLTPKDVNGRYDKINEFFAQSD